MVSGAIVTLGWGLDRKPLATMSVVRENHHCEILFNTIPLKGMAARMRSVAMFSEQVWCRIHKVPNALCLSVVTSAKLPLGNL